MGKLKKFLHLVGCLLFTSPLWAPINSRLNIATQDGTTCNTYPYKAIFANTACTDNGDGTVSISSSGGSGGAFIVSLSTGVFGILPAANFVSTASYTTSTQTWTAQQTFNNTVIVSTTVGLGGVGTVGTAGQVLTSGGNAAIPTWTTPISLSSLSATQPILYNSGSGVFTATLVSLSTGVMGTLQAAQEPAHTGDVTNSAGSLATTAAAAQPNVTTFSSSITFSNANSIVAKGTSTFSGNVQISSGLLVGSSAGTNGQVLTSGGPNTVPTWVTGIQNHLMQAPVTATTTSSTSTLVTGNFAFTNIAATITPTSSSSNIIVLVSGEYSITSTSVGNFGFFSISRGTTNLGDSTFGLGYETNYVSSVTTPDDFSVSFYTVDSPATTSATTYTVTMKATSPATVTFARAPVPETITLLEVQ